MNNRLPTIYWLQRHGIPVLNYITVWHLNTVHGCSTFLDLRKKRVSVFRIYYLYLFCIGSRRHATVTPPLLVLNLTQTMVVAAFALVGAGLCIARPIHLVCSAVWDGNYFVAWQVVPFPFEPPPTSHSRETCARPAPRPRVAVLHDSTV